MIGFGTIMNAAGIVLGGLLGLLVGGRIPKRFQDLITKSLGLSVLFISVSGVISKMCRVGEGGVITTGGELMMIISLVLGAVVGELINLEDKTERLGQWLKEKTRSSGDNQFVDSFVNASLTVCIGAMAIVGAIEDGLFGNYSILLTKTILDIAIIVVLASSQGKGAIFSVIPCVVLQGSVTLFAQAIRPIMTLQAQNNLSLVGNALIFCIGINLMFGKKVRVANLLPSILFAVILAFIPYFN